jgi:hypothetical protein
MNATARNTLVSLIKHPYAWPGGYERMMITTDGVLLCSECVRKEARRIMADIRDGYATGWMPGGTCYEAISPDCTPDDCKTYCDHCGKEVGELGN